MSESPNWDDIDRALPSLSATAWEALSHDRALPRIESKLNDLPAALPGYLKLKGKDRQFYDGLASWEQVNWQRQADLWWRTGTST